MAYDTNPVLWEVWGSDAGTIRLRLRIETTNAFKVV